jgi:hypothetical protein
LDYTRPVRQRFKRCLIPQPRNSLILMFRSAVLRADLAGHSCFSSTRPFKCGCADRQSVYVRLRAPDSLRKSVLEESERSVRPYGAAESEQMVASMEPLSLISSTHEVERLVELLAARKVTVVLVLREGEAFVKSLRLQVQRLGLPTTSDFMNRVSIANMPRGLPISSCRLRPLTA